MPTSPADADWGPRPASTSNCRPPRHAEATAVAEPCPACSPKQAEQWSMTATPSSTPGPSRSKPPKHANAGRLGSHPCRRPRPWLTSTSTPRPASIRSSSTSPRPAAYLESATNVLPHRTTRRRKTSGRRVSPGRSRAGYRTYFTTTADLAARCHRAAIEGRRATTMRFFAGPTLLSHRRARLPPAARRSCLRTVPGRVPALPEDQHRLTTNRGVASGRGPGDPPSPPPCSTGSCTARWFSTPTATPTDPRPPRQERSTLSRRDRHPPTATVTPAQSGELR